MDKSIFKSLPVRSPQALDIIYKLRQHHTGKEHAIPRKDLLTALNKTAGPVSDRAMRLSIEYARQYTILGAWICSTNKGDGYYMAANRAELLEYIESEKGRAMSILAKISNQGRRALPELSGQFNYIERLKNGN